MKQISLLIGFVFAVLTSCLVINQYILRFYLDTDVLGSITTHEIADIEAVNFANSKIWYFIYAVAVSIALFLSPAIFSRLDHYKTDGNKAISMLFKAFVCMCLLAATSGLIISFNLGSPRVGGEAMKFYWSGLAFIMLVSILNVSYAYSNGYIIMMRDWLIHLYGMILLPISIFPMIFVWFYGLHFTIHEAMITAVTIAFAGHFLFSFYITVQLLGNRSR